MVSLLSSEHPPPLGPGLSAQKRAGREDVCSGRPCKEVTYGRRGRITISVNKSKKKGRGWALKGRGWALRVLINVRGPSLRYLLVLLS